MSEIEFYEALNWDIQNAFVKCQNTISIEELNFVSQKISRIQRLIQIQIQELGQNESG